MSLFDRAQLSRFQIIVTREHVDASRAMHVPEALQKRLEISRELARKMGRDRAVDQAVGEVLDLDTRRTYHPREIILALAARTEMPF